MEEIKELEEIKEKSLFIIEDDKSFRERFIAIATCEYVLNFPFGIFFR